MTRRRRILLFFVGVFAAGCLVTKPQAVAGVVNGDFEQFEGGRFVGWDTLTGFASPTQSRDPQGRAFARLDDGPLESLGALIEQQITISPSMNWLSFDFFFESDGVTADPFPLPDVFGASLFDAETFESIFATDGDRFLSINDRGQLIANDRVALSGEADGLRPGWTRAELDLGSLAGSSVLLEFALDNGLDPDVRSFAHLDNVRLTAAPQVIPEPSGMVVALLMIATATVLGRGSGFAKGGRSGARPRAGRPSAKATPSLRRDRG